MQTNTLSSVGFWKPGAIPPFFSFGEMIAVMENVREPVHIIRKSPEGSMGLGHKGSISPSGNGSSSDYMLMATLPAIYPEWLGDRTFQEVHKLRFPYVAGAMYHGIASTTMVIEMAKAGMIGFFGSAGLPLPAVEKAVFDIRSSLEKSNLSWGINLIYSPHEPALEDAIVDMYLKQGVKRISAAAFMRLSPAVVRFSATGLKADPSGNIIRENHIFAKLSRPEVAKHFMEPAPKKILDLLVSQGKLTQKEADIAAHVPVAEDITVEADSGGHTDNRPLPALFPTILSLRNEIVQQYGYKRPIRVGAAGGLGTPVSVAGAFSMGAAYVLTGSINQSAVESGLSMEGRKMLAKAGVADMTMAPAADMFELGVKVQVLKRGTLFSSRAAQFYRLYTSYDSIENIPQDIKSKLEKEAFRAPLEKIWKETRDFFLKRNPREIEKADKDPKYKMALVFRWYLGNSARWAMEGDTERHSDYQICCGPSIGAFNSWVKGTFLENPENRTVANIALNLLEGAAVITRAQQLRTYGVPVPADAFNFRPKPLI
ncbi:MAG: PfaD family polyunsaturated fatty acid/polyketide biosynthesis protein [Proteobacteria bacterium]|nr:PfaD family polyunsaturated fatty acid/polyketide biosynthesis protein [Pseudomonadota bacterium]